MQKNFLSDILLYQNARMALARVFEMLIQMHGRSISVLTPSFICSDLLVVYEQFEVTPVWYSDERLWSPNLESCDKCDAVLCVNYFGFPFEESAWVNYQRKHGAFVIEDNAHGFLSRDKSNKDLGTRGDFGLFSFRKTIRMPDGGGLWINGRNRLFKEMLVQPSFTKTGARPIETFKVQLRGVPIFGEAAYRSIVSVKRRMRRVGIVRESEHMDYRESIGPFAKIEDNIRAVCRSSEVYRRRSSYLKLRTLAKQYNVMPLFDDFYEGFCPYGFPFIEDDRAASRELGKVAGQMGFDLVQWPDLPKASSELAHKNTPVQLVNFIW